MEKKHREFLLVFTACSMILLTAILAAFIFQKSLDDPATCNLCHKMEPYVSSFLKPEEGSMIADHKLNCLGCHANTSPDEARSAVLREIEAGAFKKITGIEMDINTSALAVNCTRCHLTLDSRHPDISMTARCRDCHWAHIQVMGVSIKKLDIPYGPHTNQSCPNCHGTVFEIPRCIKCHQGHGEQKLENSICLACHTDPHVPIKPGILPNNTVEFTSNLSFSLCQPCHEEESIELTNSGSLHSEMQTCVRCHGSHGEKPKCGSCHRAMKVEQHLTIQCEACHLTSSVTAPCQDCHGKSHDWSAGTAKRNSK